MPTYYDIHCHLFNKDILKARLADKLMPLIAFAEANTPQGMEGMLKTVKRLRHTLEIIEQDTAGVFAHLDDAYANEFVVTPLMFDLAFADDNDASWEHNAVHTLRQEIVERIIDKIGRIVIRSASNNAALKEAITMDDGRTIFQHISASNGGIFPEENYGQQMTDLEDLARDPANNGRVRPFFGIDPRRYNGDVNWVISDVRTRCLGEGALWAGVKLYAPAGFSPTDKLLFGSKDEKGGLYEFCEENNIPITVHCSQSGFACLSKSVRLNGYVNRRSTRTGNILWNDKVVYYDNRPYQFNIDFLSVKIGHAIEERAWALNHPKLWRLVLERFPNLKLNLAHFGNSDSMMEYVHHILPFDELSPTDFWELKRLYEPEEVEVIKQYFYLDGGKWKLNIRMENIPAETPESIQRRKILWDLLASKNIIDCWTKHILEIIQDNRFPNVCTDLSCFTEEDEQSEEETIAPALKEFKEKLYDTLAPEVKQKVLYGSDFWLNVMQGPKMAAYIRDFRAVFGAEFVDIASVHPERFLGIS